MSARRACSAPRRLYFAKLSRMGVLGSGRSWDVSEWECLIRIEVSGFLCPRGAVRAPSPTSPGTSKGAPAGAHVVFALFRFASHSCEDTLGISPKVPRRQRGPTRVGP